MTKPFTPLISSTVLFLVLSQSMVVSSALASEPQPSPAPAATSPAATAPAPSPSLAQPAAPNAAETARAKSEERRAAMLEQRKKRYAELRASAAEIGVEMPEMPPWEAAWPEPPAMPTRPDLWPEEDAAMRQWHEDTQARMQRMTPEERQAMREERWKTMRTEAAERGIEMPETPPWVEAEKRREEMAKRFEEYRETIKQMTEEQRKAAHAVFGQAPARMHPMCGCNEGQGRAPWGYPGHGAYWNPPGEMRQAPPMLDQNAPR